MRETKGDKGRSGKQWVIGKQGETDGDQRQWRLRHTRKRGRQMRHEGECGDRETYIIGRQVD